MGDEYRARRSACRRDFFNHNHHVSVAAARPAVRLVERQAGNAQSGQPCQLGEWEFTRFVYI